MGVVGGALEIYIGFYVFIGVMADGCWSELRGGCFWEVYNVLMFSSLLKPIGDIWFGCSREVGCLLDGLLIKVLQ